jgi:ATP-dependent protease Clp ATPase subunit
MAHADSHCGFCGRASGAVRKLISGPRVFICDDCVEACVDLASPDEETRPGAPAVARLIVGAPNSQDDPQECRFCGKSLGQVRLHFLGFDPDRPDLSICAECIGLCIDVLAEDFPERLSDKMRAWPEVAGD